jgi:hypothetical protein
MFVPGFVAKAADVGGGGVVSFARELSSTLPPEDCGAGAKAARAGLLGGTGGIAGSS